jgi:hypothetical protein
MHIKEILLILLAAIYIVYTVKFCIEFNKTIIYKGAIKKLHFVLFWFIPFVWIFIIKNISKSTPGSHQVEKKEEPIPFSSAYSGP